MTDDPHIAALAPLTVSRGLEAGACRRGLQPFASKCLPIAVLNVVADRRGQMRK
jgi:hypothetical protein